ncbi:MAG TPA: glucokinase [Rhodanobacteraceae bacterium]
MPSEVTAIDTATAVIAADVGGTHARIGLLDVDKRHAPPVQMRAWQVYTCADWPGLGEILDDFVRGQHVPQGSIARAALAVAGYVRNGEVIAERLQWPIRIAALRQRLGVARLDIINDFEALANATRFLAPSDGTPVIHAEPAAGPSVVLGPGTGLGCAVLFPTDDGAIVMPSEAGHVALAPGTAREIDALRQLSDGRTYVHVGDALSGPGLLNLYRALAALDGVDPTLDDPKQVSVAALRGDDAHAREALAMFCALLGSFAGDLAITFKATGGVVLAGGILPAVQAFLLASDFRKRFLNKGVLRDFLAGVPVRLIEHGQLGVIGAAAMALPTGVRHA